MKTIFKFVLAITLLSAWSANAASVWKVTNGKNTVYIGGTIHLLKEDSFPLPSEYDKAYSVSDKLIFETDVDALQTPEFQQKAAAQMVLTDGTTLQSRLSEETYQALSDYLASKGIPVQNFQPLKPAAVALTISVLEFQANGFLAQGVDQFYTSKANTDNKSIGWLESVDEQLGFIANLAQGEDETMIKYTLEDLDELPNLLGKMLQSWETGNLNDLDKFMVADMKKEAPEMYQAILVDRNNNWIPKITDMLNDKQTEFVLVGVAHLAGEDSVLGKLEAKGFKVERLQ